MIEFSFDAITNFDEHIELSIPNYRHIYELIENISSYFIKNDTVVYDLGCSTGLILKFLSIKNKAENVRFIGYDISDNLKPQNEIGFSWIKADLTSERLSLSNSSLILSIFTLQFLDIEKLQILLKRIYENLNKGGALIVCEKCYIENSFLSDVFTFSYYDFKTKSFTDNEILSKQRDLRYIMRPQTESENLEMFRAAGFKVIECFFTSLMFKGWIMIK